MERSDVGCKVVVCYGHPEDSDAFDAHYRDVHIPLARRIPGLSGYSWESVEHSTAAAPPSMRLRRCASPMPRRCAQGWDRWR